MSKKQRSRNRVTYIPQITSLIFRGILVSLAKIHPDDKKLMISCINNFKFDNSKVLKGVTIQETFDKSIKIINECEKSIKEFFIKEIDFYVLLRNSRLNSNRARYKSETKIMQDDIKILLGRVVDSTKNNDVKLQMPRFHQNKEKGKVSSCVLSKSMFDVLISDNNFLKLGICETNWPNKKKHIKREKNASI